MKAGAPGMGLNRVNTQLAETKRPSGGRPCDTLNTGEAQRAFWIFPAFRQDAHTLTRFTDPSTTARTSCRFGSHRRGDLLFAWLTLLPATGFLPQISQTFAIMLSDSFQSYYLLAINIEKFSQQCNRILGGGSVRRWFGSDANIFCCLR